MTEQSTAVAAREQAGGVNVSVRDVKAQTAALHRLFKDVLVPDTHYGTIPGTPKPTLYKPGAEKIGLMLHLAPSFTRIITHDDDHMTVISECKLISQETGTVIAEAGALCTTRETKYAYRQATRKCPNCGKEAIIKGKKEFGGGWLCFAKKGGCGHKWPDGAKEIESQSEEREENPNLPDTYNTVLKIADKRAFVAAMLFGTAASDIFTQDVEDFRDEDIRGKPARTDEPDPGWGDEPGPGELSSDELEAHIHDLESAFERGEGPSWWAANSKPILANCTKEQKARLVARKDELKAAHPTAPATTEPVKRGPGRPSKRDALEQEMRAAFQSGKGAEWWKFNSDAVGALKVEDQDYLSGISQDLEADEAESKGELG